MIVTLTDYSAATHRFDPAIAAAILATAETRRRHVAAVADWCRANEVDGVDVDWEALTAGQRRQLRGVRRGARPAAARRRPPHRRRCLPQDQRAGRMGRAAGAGLAAPGPGRRPVPRDDLQLLGVLVRARPALAARMDGQGARLRRDAGRAAQDRHGRRLLRPRLARRQDHRPGVDGRPADPLGRHAARIARPLGRAHALVQPRTAPRTRRSSRTPRRSTPSW